MPIYLCAECILQGYSLPRIRRESRERIMAMASILRALDPVGAILWGREVANDVAPFVPVVRTVANRPCRYVHFVLPDKA